MSRVYKTEAEGRCKRGMALVEFHRMRAAETDECILWPYCKGCQMGYGMLQYEGKRVCVHRLSWILSNGEVPDGMMVCHSCDVPLCFNQRHLFLGTHDDNMQDSKAKGRNFHPIGELSPRALLNEAEVLRIRSEYRRGVRGHGHKVLAQRYGVAYSTMRAVLSGRSWAHL